VQLQEDDLQIIYYEHDYESEGEHSMLLQGHHSLCNTTYEVIWKLQ